MERIISYPFSFIALLFFLAALIIFHPIQYICFNYIGYNAHKKSVDYLNCILLRVGHMIGNTYKVTGRELIPKDVPIIFVSNHQSLFDIACYVWFLRGFHPKFVSKKELGRGIPSVSYNLRHGGSVLIDRNDPKQAVPLISGLAHYIEKYKRSAVIFPEGTRTKTGAPKEWSQTGLKILCKYAPTAYVVPITINNSWKIVKYGFFPFGLGNRVTFAVHAPLSVKDIPFQEIIVKAEQAVIQGIKI